MERNELLEAAKWTEHNAEILRQVAGNIRDEGTRLAVQDVAAGMRDKSRSAIAKHLAKEEDLEAEMLDTVNEYGDWDF